MPSWRSSRRAASTGGSRCSRRSCRATTSGSPARTSAPGTGARRGTRLGAAEARRARVAGAGRGELHRPPARGGHHHRRRAPSRRDPSLTAGAIHDANAYSVPALARQLGAELESLATVPDDAQATRRAIEDALEHADVVVICGGVSVGAHDHVAEPRRARGRRAFLGRRVAPGKPTWFGTRGATLVFGLPGQPRLGDGDVHAVRRARGERAERRCHRPAAHDPRDPHARLRQKPPGRAHAVRCHLEAERAGLARDPTGHQRSHVLSTMLGGRRARDHSRRRAKRRDAQASRSRSSC